MRTGRFIAIAAICLTFVATGSTVSAQPEGGALSKRDVMCLAYSLVGTRLIEIAAGVSEFSAKEIEEASKRDVNGDALEGSLHLVNFVSEKNRAKLEEQANSVDEEANLLGCSADWDGTAIELRKRILDLKKRLK